MVKKATAKLKNKRATDRLGWGAEMVKNRRGRNSQKSKYST